MRTSDAVTVTLDRSYWNQSNYANRTGEGRGGDISNVQLEAENVHNLPGELQLLAAEINFMGEIC